MKKLLVCVIAIVLVAAVIGACFAAYYKVDTNPTSVAITTSFQSYTLQILDDSSHVIGNTPLDFTAFDPDHTTQSVVIGLTVNDKQYIDGNYGVLNVSLTGTLAQYIDISVIRLTAADGEAIANEPNISSLATGAGWSAPLSETPYWVRLTFTLNDLTVAAAEKTAALSVTWEVDDDTVWTYDANKYYLVGNFDESGWIVSEQNENLEIPTLPEKDGNNVAIAYHVALTAGDEIKVVKNYKDEANRVWYGTNEGNNVEIGTTGNYTIYVWENGSRGISAVLEN